MIFLSDIVNYMQQIDLLKEACKMHHTRDGWHLQVNPVGNFYDFLCLFVFCNCITMIIVNSFKKLFLFLVG